MCVVGVGLVKVYSSVQSLNRVRLYATPWITAHQASLSITNSRSLPKLMPIESVMPSNHLICSCPLLLLPPIPPSIRVSSNESTRRMRWPKYWSFSFSISPSNGLDNTGEGGALSIPLLVSMWEGFCVPFYFNKTLLHKSSRVFKPGPLFWSSIFFFGDHESDVIHRKLSVAQMGKNLLAMQEMQVRSLDWDDPLGKGMAPHSSTLAWKIPWTEEPGGLRSIGSLRVGHDWSDLAAAMSEVILSLLSKMAVVMSW